MLFCNFVMVIENSVVSKKLTGSLRSFRLRELRCVSASAQVVEVVPVHSYRAAATPLPSSATHGTLVSTETWLIRGPNPSFPAIVPSVRN